MKGKNIIFALTLLFSLLSATQISAGEIMDFDLFGYDYDDDDYYKNLSLTIKNPETAKGRVYLTPYFESDTKYCKITNNPDIAKIQGNFSDVGTGDYKVRFFVLPADGCILDCLSTPESYRSGDYKAEYVGSEEGYPLASQSFILDKDTSNRSIQRPPVGVFPPPVVSEELYAVFASSKKMVVKNKKAGMLADAVKSGTYGENVNDLVVSGPLNQKDFRYLNKLSRDKGLVRLDLSAASFKILPDSAFYESNLYELSIPQYIDSIGKYAFAYSYGLKPVKIPEKAARAKNIFLGCNLITMMEKGYISADPSFRSSYDGSQTVQNSSASNNKSGSEPTPKRRKGPSGKDLPDDLSRISEKMEVISAGSLKNRDLRKYKPEYGLSFSGSNSNSPEAKWISSLAQAPCPIAQGGWSNVGSITALSNSLIADGCPFEGAYKGDYISGYKMTEIIIERGGRILPEIDFGNFKGYWEYADVVANINHRDDNTQDKPYFTFNCAIKTSSTLNSVSANAAEVVRKSFAGLKDALITDGYKLQNPSSPTFYMCAKGGIRVKMELFLDEVSPLDSHLKITEYCFKN